MERVIRLQALEYVHVMDCDTCVVKLVEGPCCFTMSAHHAMLHDTVQKHIIVPPNHYCEVENPVVLRGEGVSEAVAAASTDACAHHNRMGHREVRLSQKPFPLYPGEVLVTDVRPLRILGPEGAIAVRALRDYTYTASENEGSLSSSGTAGGMAGSEVGGSVAEPGVKRSRVAGETWLVRGPCVYIPRVEERVERSVDPIHIGSHQSLFLSAECSFVDSCGTQRLRGDVWNVTGPGMHFLHPNSTVLSLETGIVLSCRVAVWIRALREFHDKRANAKRAPGEVWLLTHHEVPVFVPTVEMRVERVVELTVVEENQYCVVVKGGRDDPFCTGEQRLYAGPCAFFLAPDERLLNGAVQDAYILASDEALLVSNVYTLVEEDGVRREPSSRWLVHGPAKYVPPLGVSVLERRKRMALSGSEGIYVRNVRTGKIKAVHGEAVLLASDEELWEKPINPLVHQLLVTGGLSTYDPEAPAKAAQLALDEGHPKTHKVVSFKVPHNALVQLYDPTCNKVRVEAGPALVSLAPREEITVVSLSGGRPKKRDCIHSLFLFLGPDFMSDMIEVETVEHTRLQLQLAYNWEFDTSNIEKVKCSAFRVPDFVGMACKTLANRIRASIASEPFDNFHRNSASLIRQAIFHTHSGTTELRDDVLIFPVNGLIITNVDVRSVEPVEPKTRDALTKSVQLAVEIITKLQENEASHQAMLVEQEAKGALELQLMKDKVAAEAERVKLSEVTSENIAIELCGASKAQALAEAKAQQVEVEGEMNATVSRCTARDVVAAAELEVFQRGMDLELEHRRAMKDLEVAKVKMLYDIEAKKYEEILRALGQGTLRVIVQSGHELKVKLLRALGLKGFLVTDSSTPTNLSSVMGSLLSADNERTP
ncbi:Major Vault Protein repeat Shoulder domain [Trypanosoma vivax]|uniref:Putative major vault protein n=1 Tax=Trypanosoma vivax (strain Y486) TaxID=1055687 RepID=G0U5J2_TRYVY|nr:Major Vault Protein repeat Shoulder domain [Trypanosoma vivax]CCC51143.1 putative major vault protein [Trypanosoma vivax Y486]